MDVKQRLLRNAYIWFLEKLKAMGSLSKQEIENENAFLNPLSKQLQNVMKAVIKQKVQSALCNDEVYDAADKAMYEGKSVVYDKVAEELVTIFDPK